MNNFLKSTTGLLNSKGLNLIGRKSANNPNSLSSSDSSTSNPIQDSFSARRRQWRKVVPSKFLFLAVVVLLALGLLAALYISGKHPSSLVQGDLSQKSVSVNKSIEFPVRDQKGNATDKILKMNLTTADKTKQILIKGKPATARSGKTFLIVNLELDNPTQNKLGLAPVELIRLIDASDKKYAPDVHNDKVSIEPLSTKRTRVGFVVDENTSSFSLQIGEVSGKKEAITINL